MRKIFTVLSSVAAAALLCGGISYAVEGATPAAEAGVFEVSASIPAEGAALAEISRGSTISVTTNLLYSQYPEATIDYEIQRIATGESGEDIMTDPYDGATIETIKSISWLNRVDDTTEFANECYGNYTLYAGYDYRLKLEAWESEAAKHPMEGEAQSLGVQYVYFTGTNTPIIYSDLTIESVEPDPQVTPVLPADTDKITVTFTGPVHLLPGTMINEGMGASSNFQELKPIDPVEKNGNEYAVTWELIFPAGYMSWQTSTVDIAVTAEDEEGHRLKGNMGVGNNTWYEFSWTSAGAMAEPEFNFGENLICLSSFEVSHEIGIMVSWNLPVGSILVFDENGDIVARAAKVTPVLLDPDNLDEVAKTDIVTLDRGIVKPGTYSIYVPEGYFSIGTQFDTRVCAETTANVTIEPGYMLSVAPEQGEVDALQEFYIDYGVDVKLTEGAERPYVNMINGSEDGLSDQVIPVRNMYAEGTILYLCTVGEMTDAGQYQVIVPEGALTNVETEKPIGHVGFFYTIPEKLEPENPFEGLEFDPAQGYVDMLPGLIKVRTLDYPEIGPTFQVYPTLSINGGEPEQCDLTFDFDSDDYSYFFIQLPDEAGYTEDGTYEIFIPAGTWEYFANGGFSPVASNPKMTLTYVIGEAPSDNVTVDPAPGVVAQLPEWIKLTYEDQASIAANYDLEATLSINGGDPQPVMVDVNWMADPWWAENEIGINLGQVYTEDGEYVITLPAGKIEFIDADWNVIGTSQELVLVYNVDSTVSVKEIAAADFYTVYSLTGVKVLESEDASLVKALPAGIYVVNGVKTIIR